MAAVIKKRLLEMILLCNSHILSSIDPCKLTMVSVGLVVRDMIIESEFKPDDINLPLALGAGINWSSEDDI